MATAVYMPFTGSVPTPPATYVLAAGISYGSNGDPNGSPELGLGQGTDFSTGRITWDTDSDPTDPFDSGLVPVDIVIPIGGGPSAPDTMTVGDVTVTPPGGGSTGSGSGGGSPSSPGGPGGGLPILPTGSIGNGSVSYGDSTYGDIGSVIIDTGVQVNGSVAWSGLTINFMDNGSVVDSFTDPNGALVDTSTSANPVAGQEIVVTPTASQPITSVEITGSIELYATAGTYPGADDLFSDVFIMGAAS